MNNIKVNKSKLFLTVLAGAIVFAVGASAYLPPTAGYPTNSTEPVDIQSAPQEKLGGLSVYEFLATSNAQFKGSVMIQGTVQAGQVGQSPTTVNIGTKAEVNGEVHAADYLNSSTLMHSDPSPKPVCGDPDGNIVFCN